MAMVVAMMPVGVLAADEEVAEFDNQKYSSLEAAYNAMTEKGSGTITLLKNCSGNGLGNDKDKNANSLDYTIDFNGYTYTVTDNTVGSTGTVTQGFRVLQGSKAVLKNGTLKAGAGVKELKQFVHTYGDVTLKDFTIDATNNENTVIAFEADCGKVDILGKSSVLAYKGKTGLYVAFWHTGTYDGTSVNVNTTGKITGKLVYEFDERMTGDNAAKENKAILKISNGNFDITEIQTLFSGITDDKLKVAKISITGGIFSCTVNSSYIADGYVFDNSTVVKNTSSTDAVASINGQYFNTLSGAIEAVPNDGSETQIRMLNNVEIPKMIKVNDNKNIVLDLNGYNIEHKGAYVFDIYNAKFHVTGTGTIFENAVDQYAPIMARGAYSDTKDYTVITIDKGVTLKGDYSGIFVAKDENGGYNNYGLVINMSGAIDLSTIGNTDDEYYGYGLYVNGQNVKNDGNTPVINLDGAEVKGATCGIYAAGYAKWNVINSNIEGATGIEIRAGELNIEKGNKITAKVKPTEVEANGNGATTVGAGIAIAQHNTKLPIDVKVNGGEISGYTALYESNPQENQEEDIAKVKLLISGGSFTAINDGVNAVYSEDISGFITGGTFSTSPKYLTAAKSLTNYVADEYKVYKISDTEYRVAASNPSGYTWEAAKTEEQPAEYDFIGTRIYVPATPSTPADNVTNNTTDKSTTADLTPAVSDNKSTTTVDNATADKIVDKAVANKSTEVIVDATGNNTAASSEVALPEKTVKAIAEKTEAALVIKTDNGQVALDKTALAAVAEQSGDTGFVKLIVETVKTDENICHVALKLVTSNGTITDFKGGNVKVTITLDKELAAKELVCVYIDDNSIYTSVDGVLNADGTYTFVTGHFSEYAVMAKTDAEKKIAEQLNTLIKEVDLKVRTSKTSKKNIKAVVSGDVKALTDAGYTVKYKFYRSEKKASNYKEVKVKDTNTYINTTGKKGTKYYYKAKALVYDGDKLVGQTVLTQCKYGVRTWSK